MATTLGMIAIVVDDYDSAIAHYTNDLLFNLIEDKALTPEKRWVVTIRVQRSTVSPSGTCSMIACSALAAL